jgi:hypothetical protein
VIINLSIEEVITMVRFQHDYCFKWAFPAQLVDYSGTLYEGCDFVSQFSIEFICDSGISLVDILASNGIKLVRTFTHREQYRYISDTALRILEIYSLIVCWLLVSKYRTDIHRLRHKRYNVPTFGYSYAMLNQNIYTER